MNQKLEIIAQVTGVKFGRLRAAKYIGPNSNGERIWECVCDCGTKKKVKGSALRSGATKSCGCYKKDVARNQKANLKHGHSVRDKQNSAYSSWTAMRNRCKNKYHHAYHLYGGRGIGICKRWNDFESFLEDMGDRPKGMQIDRIDNNGNYEPSNCRWATPKQQSRNRATNRFLIVDGVSKCVSEWSEIAGTKKTTIRERLRRGWNAKDSIYGKEGAK